MTSGDGLAKDVFSGEKTQKDVFSGEVNSVTTGHSSLSSLPGLNPTSWALRILPSKYVNVLTCLARLPGCAPLRLCLIYLCIQHTSPKVWHEVRAS